MQDILDNIVEACRPYCSTGHVATYIPELSKGDPTALGISVADIKGNIYSSGDADHAFTIQSISKVITLCLALTELGEDIVFSKIGFEAVADPFNSIMRLEMDNPHRPHNPFINSGSIVTVSLLPYSDPEEKIEAILDLAREMAGNNMISINNDVYFSEKFTGDRNRALAYFLKSNSSMDGDVEEILDVYFKHCSIEMTARDLSVMGATLAADGINPLTGVEVISADVARVVRALMVTCGTYDGSGEFAVRVGLPAKSGVGGGIMSTLPGRMGIATYGPALDFRGNSAGGIKVMEMLSEEEGIRLL